MLTSQVSRRPDFVTPIFWVRPRDTCWTSVLSMGSRRGEEIPLPQVYTDDWGRECIILLEPRPESVKKDRRIERGLRGFPSKGLVCCFGYQTSCLGSIYLYQMRYKRIWWHMVKRGGHFWPAECVTIQAYIHCSPVLRTVTRQKMERILSICQHLPRVRVPATRPGLPWAPGGTVDSGFSIL